MFDDNAEFEIISGGPLDEDGNEDVRSDLEHQDQTVTQMLNLVEECLAFMTFRELIRVISNE